MGLGEDAVRISFVRYRATVKGFAGKKETPCSMHQDLNLDQGPEYVDKVVGARASAARARSSAESEEISGSSAENPEASMLQSPCKKTSAMKNKDSAKNFNLLQLTGEIELEHEKVTVREATAKESGFGRTSRAQRARATRQAAESPHSSRPVTTLV
jgi:hypothetical protein